LSLSLYIDVNVPIAITQGLRQRGVTVLTSQEDGTDRLPDAQLLDRALVLGFVLYTQDTDFLAEAARRLATGEPFAGVVYVHQQRLSIRQRIDDLEILAKLLDPTDMMNQVKFLPL
jgi:predicted nuclease of predicted toxin-antitoxin system